MQHRPRKFRILPRAAVPDFDRPAEDLRFIRQTMQRSAAFTAVPGWGQVVIGITALFAAWFAANRAFSLAWVEIWLVEAVLGVCLGLASMNWKAARVGSPLTSGPGRRFALGFIPPLVAGGLITAALIHAGEYSLLPAIWLLLYGTAWATGGAVSVPVVPLTGACFMGIGVLDLLQPRLGNWWMAAGFGGLQIVFGVWIARKHGG
jgi:hypothetical protein